MSRQSAEKMFNSTKPQKGDRRRRRSENSTQRQSKENRYSDLKRKSERVPEGVSSYKRRKFNNDARYRFKDLEELSQKDAPAIVIELRMRENAFKTLFDSYISNDSIVLVLEILAKVCAIDLVNADAILRILVYKETFYKTLETFVLELTVQTAGDRKKSSYFWRNRNAFLNNSAAVFRGLIKSVPSKAYEVLPRTLKAFQVMLASLSGEGIDEEVLNTFRELEQMLDTCKLERPKQVEGPNVKDDSSNVEPPNDFRSLSIYPNKEDVLLQRGFLRKNIIDASYQNVNHYLDVQFRLLKEDFVGPLRRGIAEYMNYKGVHKEIVKTSDVKVYMGVKFMSPITKNGQLGVLLQFQSTKRHQHKINLNKRFMYGSLLCFTNDNFQSLLFAKVLDRNIELLQKGQVVVELEFGQGNYSLELSYIMIECSVYFEPYYHVLNALQNMDEAKFPMKKYIIDLDLDINTIAYLDPDSEYTILNKSVTVHNFDTWPTADDFNLNTSQYEAFRTALTKELVIIQGPPGTGKTFLGLQIAKTLIENKKHWYKSSPMLVVCYTNHALDQFLEGLQDTTPNIIRVGGQSKNKNMEKFSLRGMSKPRIRQTPIVHKLYNCLKLINSCNDILKDIKSNSAIIHFKKFSIIDESIRSTWFFTAKDEELIFWLLDGKSNQGRARRNMVKHASEVENDPHQEFDQIQNNLFREEQDFDTELDYVLDDTSDHCLVSISQLESCLDNINKELNGFKRSADRRRFWIKTELEDERFKTISALHWLKILLNQYEKVVVHNKPDCSNPHMMYSENRWQLYLYWLGQYQQYLIRKLIVLQGDYKRISKEYKEIRDIIDLNIMKQSLVVGMTTTSAARLQTIIKNLESPIVVVEEAAEVLESHVVVSVTSHCKHLILIGDHQQLRPSTSNYFLEKRFNFGISLFERLVRNNFHNHVLGVQHRMRPEFANLIVPAIYPKLENDASVLNFPPIAGIVKNLFFIDHKFEETSHNDSGQLNEHEAKFLIALARYLIQNGYKPGDITILAAYSAQMFALWKEQKKCINLLEGLRIAVLDNYQGEESKIILLSLVRNNNQGKIGFLKIENRVCVALSRAREGFYIMGNMDFMVLKSQDSLGTSLLLRCQMHPDQEMSVALPDDFNNVPEGGCSKLCGAQLICGHYCTKICHVVDIKHEHFKCIAKCTKTCVSGHKCRNLCYEQCKPCKILMNRTLPCTHEHKLYCYVDINNFECPTLVQATLPCGHVDPEKPCHQPAETHQCPFPCKTRVDTCGHTCLKKCHYNDDPDHIQYKCSKPCQKVRLGCSTGDHKCQNLCFELCTPCYTVIEKTRTCSHKTMTYCNRDADETACNEQCTVILLCGHPCKQKCDKPCGNCDVMVLKKISECGHTIKMKCGEIPSRKLCKEKCTLLLACGHACQNLCKEPCTTSCKVLVDNTNAADCGHKFKIQCNMEQKVYASNCFDLLKFCDSPCGATLSCSHVCSGTCGKCLQGRIHRACSEKCGAVLVCGHPCRTNCRDVCRPCEAKCTNKCQHSECRKRCGQPCTKCTEKCTRRCRHVQCLELCGNICTVPPCTRPCPKNLPCGHSCVGFCGDPCPPLCRECNHDELTEIFFGNEDEEGARFVMLDECKHVFESTGMEKWLQGEEQGDQEKIASKCCPRCKTVLTSTQRYSDHIKKALLNVMKVKEKYYGSTADNERWRTELFNKIVTLKDERQLMKASIFDKILYTFEKAIKPFVNRRRQHINIILYTIYLAKLQIVENIVAVYKKGNLLIYKLTEYVDFLFSSLLRNEKILSEQKASDLQRELKRFSFMVKLNQIRESGYFTQLRNQPECLHVFKEIETILVSIKIFTVSLEAEVVEKFDYLSKKFDINVLIIEFNEVVKAMGMEKGHWFQCPNGHIYAIGECGGATQTGKCADCSASIGGSNHRLLSTNSHAKEVDGSMFAAYSEEANNLFNYEEFGV
ncbi:hypothetical protein RN001_014877 [Aquatica leii]|uniref:RZ-type domain-containing protein n=1 Tax=Aquatica leii TaxID=1421715 RepID=A0AAN7SKU0_9COLE|nr:hypothetical protein RN001_014877 [Aquatica leii]